jgi:methyltransferase
MNPFAVAILAYVSLERLFELIFSGRNTKRLRELGAKEHGQGHYPLMVAIHSAWLVTLWFLAYDRAPDAFWLAIYVLLQAARLWVMASLGPRWTTRIIVVPGEDLVKEGPYRFLNHPNYWVVAGEIAVLALVFGLPWVGLVFSILNAGILWVRINEENRALSTAGR